MGSEWVAYMKRSLSVDVLAVDIDFIVSEKSNDIVNVSMLNRIEEDVGANLFDLSYHFTKMNYSKLYKSLPTYGVLGFWGFDQYWYWY